MYLGHSLEEKNEERKLGGTLEQQTSQFSASLIKFCTGPIAESSLVPRSLVSRLALLTISSIVGINLPQFFGGLPSLSHSLAHFVQRRISPHWSLLLSHLVLEEVAVWLFDKSQSFVWPAGWECLTCLFLPLTSPSTLAQKSESCSQPLSSGAHGCPGSQQPPPKYSVFMSAPALSQASIQFTWESLLTAIHTIQPTSSKITL